ncbi:MAG: exodeoxyribonuclease-3 [Verrucomicrobia bacterium]|jgi:exodeoxyribonuclease III|nr:MAG: exodeoxyribonuclease-3 [Verrucomicrobiota bacterium]
MVGGEAIVGRTAGTWQQEGASSAVQAIIAETRRGGKTGQQTPDSFSLASKVFLPVFSASPRFRDKTVCARRQARIERARMKLVSWNVNGIRAALRKGAMDYFTAVDADVICLQETKAHPGDVQHVAWPKGYEPFWNSADKKGYSGTVVLTRIKPREVSYGLKSEAHDREGRVITAEFDKFYLVNVYQPNSQRGLTRLEYRTQEWDPVFLAHLRKLEKKGKPVVFCGDLNVAHTELDLTNPKTNRRNAGFTDEERNNFATVLSKGFVDTFREFEPGNGHYTWWSQMMNCRARNIGWRVDYFVASEKLRPSLKRAWISPEVMGSDHCPVGLELA